MAIPLQKFLIAPPSQGQQTDLKPWLIANDAYAILRNAYTWRGRTKKRVGARVMDQSQPLNQQQQFSRFRVNVGMTDPVTGDANGFTPVGITPAIGQMFSIGTDYFNVVALGNPSILSETGLGTGTYDTTTRAYSFNDTQTDQVVYFYPALPVMCLNLYNQSRINDEITIGFDTRLSYQYINGEGWQQSGDATQGLWSGSDSQFHWTTNYRGSTPSAYILFVVNNNQPDGIQYFDGTNWATLAPPVLNAAGDTLLTSLIVASFKDRLLFLNPTQNLAVGGVQTYSARVVYSWIGNPFDVNAFRQDDVPNVIRGGGYIEAPTKESIISCEFLKDRLIVFFENSTWELVYTNNQVLPFAFQKINTELGLESTHSVIPFDKVAIGMGSTGIHACSGVNVQRVDDMIPYTVFDISNIPGNNGPQRVYGIRDYYEELCYWTYPSTQATYESDNVYPNRVLIYDYKNGTWAFNDDSITAFGYFYLQDNLLVWQTITSTWEQMTQTWEDFASDQLFRSTICGNQQGWTFILQPDLQRNCMSLQITSLVLNANNVALTIINHNLPNNSWIFISNINASAAIMNALNNTIQQVTFVDVNTVTVMVPGLVGTYFAAGTVERVSQVQLQTKQYNFFPNEGRNVFIAYGDFNVNKTVAGAVTVDYYASTSGESMITDGEASGALIGSSILETSPYTLAPLEQVQTQLWHRIFFQTTGQTIQLNIYFSNDQMTDPDIVFSEFTLNGMLFYAKPDGMYF